MKSSGSVLGLGLTVGAALLALALGTGGCGKSGNGGAPAPTDAAQSNTDTAQSGSDAVASTPAARCTSTGGTVRMSACCQATGDFPSSCTVGACGCSPEYSHEVMTCACPSGRCFVPEEGCIATGVCTPGQDQTCNDSPMTSSLHGTCQPNGACTCKPGFARNPATGRCR